MQGLRRVREVERRALQRGDANLAAEARAQRARAGDTEPLETVAQPVLETTQSTAANEKVIPPKAKPKAKQQANG